MVNHSWKSRGHSSLTPPSFWAVEMLLKSELFFFYSIPVDRVARLPPPHGGVLWIRVWGRAARRHSELMKWGHDSKDRYSWQKTSIMKIYFVILFTRQVCTWRSTHYSGHGEIHERNAPQCQQDGGERTEGVCSSYFSVSPKDGNERIATESTQTLVDGRIKRKLQVYLHTSIQN